MLPQLGIRHLRTVAGRVGQVPRPSLPQSQTASSLRLALPSRFISNTATRKTTAAERAPLLSNGEQPASGDVQGTPARVAAKASTTSAQTVAVEPADVPAVAVFVANLPFHATTEDIEAHLAPVGKVARIRLGRNNGRSAGFATLSMEDPNLDDEAIEYLNQHELGGRQLRAKRSQPKRRDFSVLHIAGWPETATLQDIESVIRGAGVATHVDVPAFDAGSRVGRFGFLRFSTPEAGSEALERLRALTIKGQPLSVNGSAVQSRDSSIFLGNLPVESLPQGSVIETRNALASTFESLTGHRPTFIRLHTFPDGSPKNSAHVKLADAASVKQVLEAYREDPDRFRIGEHQLKLQKVQPQIFSANKQPQPISSNEPW